jgi:cell division protein FtsB
MAWTEDENKKAGWVQKKLRLKAIDAANLAAVAEMLNLNQSEAVAELCRRFLKKVKR